MKLIAETERLLLREIVADDDIGLFELDSDIDVHRYLGNTPIESIEHIRRVIEFIKQQYIDNGTGRWAIIEKETNTFIGWAGLKLIKEETNHHIGYYDVGYRFIKKYWGKGYATEAADACLAYGFERMQLKEIYAIADAENTASHHVLQKIGMTFRETFHYQRTIHHWYKITKDGWMNKKRC